MYCLSLQLWICLYTHPFIELPRISTTNNALWETFISSDQIGAKHLISIHLQFKLTSGSKTRGHSCCQNTIYTISRSSEKLVVNIHRFTDVSVMNISVRGTLRSGRVGGAWGRRHTSERQGDLQALQGRAEPTLPGGSLRHWQAPGWSSWLGLLAGAPGG